jgi:hypothetical protein
VSGLREAAQAALDWIEAQPHPRMLGAFDTAEQLRAALAEQEREWAGIPGTNVRVPVAWGPGRLIPQTDSVTIPRTLNVAPRREWVGLTEEDIEQVLATADRNSAQYRRTPGWAHLITATEAALKEKNA